MLTNCCWKNGNSNPLPPMPTHTQSTHAHTLALTTLATTLSNLKDDLYIHHFIIAMITSNKNRINPAHHPKRYKPLIQKQNKLGWQQLIKGHLTLEFIDYLNAWINTNNMNISREIYATHLIHFTWMYVLNNWKTRC